MIKLFMLPQTWKMVSLKKNMYTVHCTLCTYDGLHLARKNVSGEVYFQFEKKTASHLSTSSLLIPSVPLISFSCPAPLASHTL